jgi:thioredoxin reductase (NADPH)
MEKIIIIGSGCAGLTAAIYATRANLNPLVLTGDSDGGALTQTHDVENFPGFVEATSGFDIVSNIKEQAKRLGARFKNAEVKKIEPYKDYFIIHLRSEEKIEAQSVIIATGTTARWLDIAGEDKYKGNGVSVCATCDGFFFKGKDVAVVGGGNTALYEALYMSGIAKKVYLIHRRQEFRGGAKLVDMLKEKSNVEFVLDAVIDQIHGDEKLESVTIANTRTGDKKKIELDGVFCAIGNTPNTEFVKDLLAHDDSGYIKLEDGNKTSVSGIFACGDCASPEYRQAVIAAGDGAKASIQAEHHLMEKSI